MAKEIIHLYPYKVVFNIRALLLLLPAIVFALTLAILVAAKF